MSSPSAHGRDLSSLWHSFAPPPPPGSASTPTDQKRRSASYYAETGERARHDSLPTSSFSPAPERSVSRNANIDRRASTAASSPVARDNNRSSMPPPISTSAMSQSPGDRISMQSLPRIRHDSSPMLLQNGAQGQHGFRAVSPSPIASQPSPYHPPAHHQAEAPPLHRANSAQYQHPSVAPVAYGLPQMAYQQNVSVSPISPGMSPFPSPGAAGPAQPQPLASPQSHPHPQHQGPQPVQIPQQMAYASQPYVAFPAQGQGYPAGGYVPQQQQPGSTYPQMAHAMTAPAAYSPYAPPAALSNGAPGMMPAQYPQHPQQYAPHPMASTGQPPVMMGYAGPPAVVQAQINPSQTPANVPQQYAIPPVTLPYSQHAPQAGAMGPPPVPPPGHGSFSGTKRPLPQPARSTSLEQDLASPTTAGQPASAIPANLASMTGSVRRSLPQLPPGVGPAKDSAGGGQPGSTAGYGMSGTLNRTESVRMAAEALMARGPPRRAGGGFGSVRNRPPIIPSSASNGAAGDGRTQEQIQSALASSQSDPTAFNYSSATSPSLDSVTQSLHNITLQGSSSQPAGSSAQAFFPESMSTVPEHEHASSVEPPGRPKSRGAHHSVSQTDLRGAAVQQQQEQHEQQQQQQPSFAGNTLPRVASPKPRVAHSTPQTPAVLTQPPAQSAAPPAIRADIPSAPSPAPARYVPYQPTQTAQPPSIAVAAPLGVEPPQRIASPAPARAPPVIFEPSSQSKSSVPTISLPGDDDAEFNAGPSIPVIVTGDVSPAPPIISISDDEGSNGPVIAVSSADDHQESGAAQKMPNGAPQRATSGFTGPPPNSTTAPASASSMGSGATCGGCRKWIGGRVVQAMGLTWHPQCFKCSHCSQHLEHFAFYEHEGRPYCHVDFHELFSIRCFSCRTPIVDERFIAIDDEQLGKRYYHDLHFFCANCGDPFVDPKAAAGTAGADEQALIADEQGVVQAGGKAFVVVKGYPYCEKCHVNLHHPRCKGCKQPITADLITALKGKWHPHCFVCESCKRPFEGERFFEKDGKAWDEECYKIMLRNEL